MKTLLKELIGNNPIILGIIFLLVTAFGICYIIGAVKNWDWLYNPNPYGSLIQRASIPYTHSALPITARVLGFIFGIVLTVIGIFAFYDRCFPH